VLNQTLTDISKCIQWQTNWIFVSQTKWNIWQHCGQGENVVILHLNYKC